MTNYIMGIREDEYISQMNKAYREAEFIKDEVSEVEE